MSAPQVPPRPVRSPHQHLGGLEAPKVPPRPSKRNTERSQSPAKLDHFPRSPFNEPLGPYAEKTPGLTMTGNDEDPGVKLPRSPSNVSLPTIGQEGKEYADVIAAEQGGVKEEKPKDPSEPHESRNVAGDLPLHAPKPSFSKDTAKQRFAAVTRTNSDHAGTHGIGKAPTPTGSADQDRSKRVSFRPPSSASTERPSSAQYEEEQGIPEIGQRVPMYPDAGDVQAPSTSPFPQSPVGIGFHNSGYAKPGKHHRRTPSGREVLPPGSYGLHGHGYQSADQFEQQWYAKHPEALEKEEGEYGPSLGHARHEWAMSRDELNKLVRDTAANNYSAVGPPNEQIGYQASEQYASRAQLPHSEGTKLRSRSSLPTVTSPLRKSSFPVDADAHVKIRKMDSQDSTRQSVEQALESETEDEDLHIAPPTERRSKFTSNGYEFPKEDLGPTGGNQEGKGGYIEETGYGVPILASDEVARTPQAEYMQPAVSPAQSRRGSAYFGGQDDHGLYKTTSRGASAANSRPTSRAGSIHKFPTHDDRDDMHTPLEDVDEYEPLFPDEEGNKKPSTAAQRLKLREQMKRFPSQDIWEDTPNSLQLQATVDTPEEPAAQADAKSKSSAAVFETPEQEARRKGEVSEAEKAKLVPKEERLAKSQFIPHLREEMHRPGMKQRFPSRDIWEDSPDSAELTATVGEDGSIIRSPPDEGLEAGAVVQTSGAPKDGITAGEQLRDSATTGAIAVEKPDIPPRANKAKSPPSPDLNQQPPVPARPPKRLHQVPPAGAKAPIAPSKLSETRSPMESMGMSPTEGRKAPSLPERPKPEVPARPAKPPPEEPSDPLSLTKVTSASSVGTEGSEKGVPPAAPKTKPAVPARPAGGKIAALQGGFLADLNSRLKLGPQGPKPQEKEPEPDEEKAPLADARKGRAKGPMKRKPAAAASPAPGESKPVAVNWGISAPATVWEIDDTGAVTLSKASLTSGPNEADAHVQSKGAMAKQTATPQSPEAKSLSPAYDSPATDVATPSIEKDRNPLSIALNTPVAESPVKGPTPLTQSQTVPSEERSTDDAYAPVALTDSQSQTGEKEITIMPGTEQGEKLTAILGGKAQAAEGEAGDGIVRES